MKGKKIFFLFQNNFPELKALSLQNEKIHQVPSIVIETEPYQETCLWKREDPINFQRKKKNRFSINNLKGTGELNSNNGS